MKIALINNTSYGASGGHLKYLNAILPYLEKFKEVDALEVISPFFYNDYISKKYSKKIRFKNFKPLNIIFGQTCSKELKEILDKFCPDIIFLPDKTNNFILA